MFSYDADKGMAVKTLLIHNHRMPCSTNIYVKKTNVVAQEVA